MMTDVKIRELSQNATSNENLENKKIIEQEKNIVYKPNKLELWYGDFHALKNINLDIAENEVTAIIGPAGCGKSTDIKPINRMIELIPSVKASGEIIYRDKNIFDKKYSVEELRKNVCNVFQKPN